MTNGKTPLYLTILALVLALALVLTLQPYSAPSRWYRYAGPTRSYLRAALRQDSLALARLSLTAAPVSWALHAARTHPRAMDVWSRYARPSWGLEQGDTAIVYLDTDTDVCSEDPIVLHFIGGGKEIRVFRATSACFEAP
jgi:hypothetical protein